jgi:tetratricopeptide (TPR) repeat protein
MRLLMGQVHVRRGDWAPAADVLKRGVQGMYDGQTRARALFLRGQVLETMDRYAEAAGAYRSAAAERPRYEVAYAAETSALRTAVRAGKGQAVFEQISRMERDEKNESKRPSLALLRAQLYRAQDRPDRARTSYEELLYPGEERSSEGPSAPAEVRGRAHYELGMLYRDTYGNFTLAAAHFDSAATSLGSSDRSRTSGRGLQPTAYAVTDSRRLADQYGHVADAAGAVARIDSLLRLGRMDDEAFRTFVDSLRRAKAEEMQEAQEKEARRRAERRFQQGGGRRQNGGRGGAPSAPSGGDESGFLFHRDPAKVQQALRAFRRQWGERPRVPNWRRRKAISTRADAQVPGDPSKTVGPENGLPAAGLPQVDVSAVPRRADQRDTLRVERAAARYNLGNALLLSVNRPDSAAVWFRRVIEAGTDSAVVRRARYALAEAERAAGRAEKARRYYRLVAREQRGTELAQRAMQHLDGEEGSEDAERARATAATVRAAEDAYARAHRSWKGGGNEKEAFERFLRVAATYPEARSAPRALWAAARLAAVWSRRDGRSLTDPLPVTVPEGARALLADSAAASPPASDTSAAAPDTAAPDTTARDTTARDTTARDTTARDTTASERPSAAASSAAPPPTLHRLLTVLVRRFPNAPQADPARRMKRALRERYADHFAPPAAEPDTAAARDSAAAPDTAPDTLAAPADSARKAADAEEQPAQEERAERVENTAAQRDRRMQVARRERGAASRSPMQADSTQADSTRSDSARALAGSGGPWTIVAATVRNQSEAEAVATKMRGRFAEAAVRVVPPASREQSQYRVAVGRFASRGEARATRRRFRAALPSDSRPVKLPAEQPPEQP